MFVKLKVFIKFVESVVSDFKKQQEATLELSKQLDSLAKELGYEWTSEAVKINDDVGMTATEIDYRKKNGIGEKAVLRYSWKKIDNARFVHPTGMEIVKGELKVMKKNKKYRLPE